MRTRVLVPAVLLMALPLCTAPAETTPTSRTRIDWFNRELRLSIEARIPTDAINRPAAAHAALSAIEAALPSLFLSALRPLVVESSHSMGDLMLENDRLVLSAAAAAREGRRAPSVISRDLTTVTSEYIYPIHELLARLIPLHGRAQEMPRSLQWTPTTNFSGLIIHAQGLLPVRGEHSEARVAPCVYPAIYDENMNPVLLKSMGDPAFLRRWGTAAYAADSAEQPHQERIGLNPLRVRAVGVFGTYRSDVLIPAAAADMLLFSRENRAMLSQGRVLILIDP